MDLMEIISNFFEKYKKAINFDELMSVLKIKMEDRDDVLKILYRLQLDRKIFKDEYDNYIHMPSDFYLKTGFVTLSNRGNFYIIVDNHKVLLRRSREYKIHEGDFVYVELINDNNNLGHDRYLEGIIRGVVSREKDHEEECFLEKGIIHKSNTGKYYLITSSDNKWINLSTSSLETSYPGDMVTALISYKNGRYFAEIKDVIERGNGLHVFEYVKYHGKLCWVPSGRKYYHVELLSDNNFLEGDRIFASISHTTNDTVYIDFISQLDKSSNPVEVAREMAFSYGFVDFFSDKAMAEAKSFKMNDKSNSRVDYTNLKTFTIDSEDAKDLDDAISIERLDNGNYVLYVHIADVTYFLKKGMKLYEEGYKKGTSAYLVNYVFPMLPRILSNGLCSLNEGELKYTKTCKMIIDKDNGKIIDFFITNSIIKSDKKMTYQNIDDILEKGIIPADYSHFLHEIYLMRDLSEILSRAKFKRGYTCFYSDEVKFSVDNDGYVIDTVVTPFSISRKIIENFMLSANEVVASYLYYLGIPSLYRNHEAPHGYKLENVIEELVSNGYLKGANLNDPYLIPKLLKRFKKKKEFEHLSKIILKSMTKAYYSPSCRGHYGLALSYYTHFTSPIRRFPDIKVHEALNYVLDGEVGLKNFDNTLEEDGKFLSEREIAAASAEKEYDQYLLRSYMDQFIGKEMEVKITFIDKEYIYLKTIDNIEGILCHGGNYNIKQKSLSKDGINYRIGDIIKVNLNSFSYQYGMYQFNWINEKGKTLKKVK